MHFLHIAVLFLLTFSNFTSYCGESFSTFYGDPSGIIFDAVDGVSGSYREKEIDLVVQAPTPLILQRNYSSNRGLWCFFPQCSLIIGKLEKTHVAITSESVGMPLVYRQKSDSEYVFDLGHHQGIVNTAAGKISAQTHLKNSSIKVEGEESRCIVTTSNGTLRFYSRNSKKRLGILCENSFPELKEMSFYRLVQEILPSGNKILYHYSDEGFLVEIQATNEKKTKLFCSLKFHYGRDQIKAQASDGQTVTYHFHNELLTKVNASCKPKIRYYYNQRSLIKKELPDGRFLALEYTDKTKVKALYTQASSKPLFTFHYEKNHTIVTHALRQKTRYSYRDGVLESKEVYEGDSLYRKEKWIWGKGVETGKLLAHIFSDSQGRPLSAHRYYYDPQGNIIRDELHGNVLGGTSEVGALDIHNKVIEWKAPSQVIGDKGSRRATIRSIRQEQLQKEPDKAYWDFSWE